MSGFQLTASLASSLAWPVLVLAIAVFAWIRRAAIATFFNSSSKPSPKSLKRFKAGPVEFEWEQLIESTEKQVATVGPLVSSNMTIGQMLSDIADTVPTAAVLEAFARVERRLREVTANLPIIPNMRVPPVRAMARQAFENGLISEEIAGAIFNLSRLRNEAAHRVGEADISASQAHEYLDLVDRVLEAMATPGSGKEPAVP